MADRETLKQIFVTGAIPTQDDFHALIDTVGEPGPQGPGKPGKDGERGPQETLRNRVSRRPGEPGKPGLRETKALRETKGEPGTRKRWIPY